MADLKGAKSISVDEKRRLLFPFPQLGPKMGLPARFTQPGLVPHKHPLVNVGGTCRGQL